MYKTLGEFYRESAEINIQKSRDSRQDAEQQSERAKSVLKESVNRTDEKEEKLANEAIQGLHVARSRVVSYTKNAEVHAKKAKRLERFKWPVEVGAPFTETSQKHGVVVNHRFRIDTVDGKHAGTFTVSIPYKEIFWEDPTDWMNGKPMSFGSYSWQEKETSSLAICRAVVAKLVPECRPMEGMKHLQNSLMSIYNTFTGMVGYYCGIAGHDNVFCGAGMPRTRDMLVFAVSTSYPSFYTFVLTDPVFVNNSELLTVERSRGSLLGLDRLMYLNSRRLSGSMPRRERYWHRKTKEECETSAGVDLVINTWENKV